MLLSVKELGYERSVYQRLDDGFLVIEKNPKLASALLSGNAMSRMMVKFTKHQGNKTRIDLVNAGSDLIARKEVEKDIQTLEQTFIEGNSFIKSDAIKIGEKALIPIFGETMIQKERPFNATLVDDIWRVEGTLHCPGSNMCLGGVATAEISAQTGEALKTYHTE